MWLLDANMDVHLLGLLAEYGIECEAATRRGWGGLSNGELVAGAIQAGFTCILTQDRLFAESVMKARRAATGIAVVVVRLPQRGPGESIFNISATPGRSAPLNLFPTLWCTGPRQSNEDVDA